MHENRYREVNVTNTVSQVSNDREAIRFCHLNIETQVSILNLSQKTTVCIDSQGLIFPPFHTDPDRPAILMVEHDVVERAEVHQRRWLATEVEDAAPVCRVHGLLQQQQAL
jgi:hypothetical protein